jgi:hypothetical protein
VTQFHYQSEAGWVRSGIKPWSHHYGNIITSINRISKKTMMV